MNYISTKELSEKWQISESRIVRLAKAGRIKGAKLVGKSWVFPADASKPADRRYKGKMSETDIEHFRFPLYLYCGFSDEEIENGFSDDEKTLYACELLFYKGEFESCAERLKVLQEETRDRYVRFGALYYLSIASIYLYRCSQAYFFRNELNILYAEETLHQNELVLVIHNLETYFTGNEYYIKNFAVDTNTEYPIHMREYLLLDCAYAGVMRASNDKGSASPEPFELFFHTGRNHFSALASLTMHLYIAIMYMMRGERGKCSAHLRESCRIAEINDMEHSIVTYMAQYFPDMYKDALEGYDDEMLERFKKINAEIFEAYHRLLEYTGKNSILKMLDSNDIILISCAAKDMPNKEIASILHLSMNTISKRYSILYDKTGAHSKKELVDLYGAAIKTY